VITGGGVTNSPITAAINGAPADVLFSGSGGLNPLYQIGGPRSAQLALKFLF